MLYPNRSTTRPRVSSPFGRRPGVGAFPFHYGADLIGFRTIHAVAAGRVTFAGWLNDAAGYTVIIDHGGGVTSLYMHNARHHVSRYDLITEGEHIADMGATGNASGNCNHLEIRVRGVSVEPLAYIAARLTRNGSATTTTKQEEEMPIAILERTNSQLTKSLYDVRTGKAIRAISTNENTSFRKAQAAGAAVYITVSDKEYKERGGK